MHEIPCSSSAAPGYDRPVSTSAKKWPAIVQRIYEVKREKHLSFREWTKRANLSHSVLSTQIGRMKSDPETSFEPATFQALADAAGVNERWLRAGEGPRDVVDGAVPYVIATPAPSPSVADASVRYGAAPFMLHLVVEPDRVPDARFGALSTWSEILAAARKERPLYGEEVWRRVADSRLFLPAPPTAEVVAYVADLVVLTLPAGVSPS